jgi:hypothetical protein
VAPPLRGDVQPGQDEHVDAQERRRRDEEEEEPVVALRANIFRNPSVSVLTKGLITISQGA